MHLTTDHTAVIKPKNSAVFTEHFEKSPEVIKESKFSQLHELRTATFIEKASTRLAMMVYTKASGKKGPSCIPLYSA